MLDTLGHKSVDQLFESVDRQPSHTRDVNLPPAADQIALQRELVGLARKNRPATDMISFLGAGAYDHFIPPAVDALAGQAPFVTAYTPYQAEASQGALQAFYEYQSLICDLTDMDVANSSLYDAGSAVAEAVLMAADLTKRHTILLPENLHPEYRQVTATYLRNQDACVQTLRTPTGRIDPAGLADALDDTTAAVVVQQPNVFGAIERLDTLASHVKQSSKAMVIAVVDPISLGLLAPPGTFPVDIVVGEGQPLGLPLALGGPYLGFFAVRNRYVRRLPGRVVGATVDADGRRAFCLTLQTREQHIRRERATSNVCTNEGLLAIRAAIYLAGMGKTGLRNVADLCFQKAQYLRRKIAGLSGYEIAFDAPTFKEFAVRCRRAPVAKIIAAARDHGILAGLELGRWYPDLTDCLLIAVTEKRTKSELDRFIDVLNEVQP